MFIWKKPSGLCVLSPWASFWEDAAGDLRSSAPGSWWCLFPLGPFEGCPIAGEAAICWFFMIRDLMKIQMMKFWQWYNRYRVFLRWSFQRHDPGFRWFELCFVVLYQFISFYRVLFWGTRMKGCILSKKGKSSKHLVRRYDWTHLDTKNIPKTPNLRTFFWKTIYWKLENFL